MKLYRNLKRDEGVRFTNGSQKLEIVAQDIIKNSEIIKGSFKMLYDLKESKIWIEDIQGAFQITPDITVEVQGARARESRGGRMELSVLFSAVEGYSIEKISYRLNAQPNSINR